MDVDNFSLENLNNIISNIQNNNQYSFKIDLFQKISFIEKNKNIIFNFIINLTTFFNNSHKIINTGKLFNTLKKPFLIKCILYIFHLIDNKIIHLKKQLFRNFYQYVFTLFQNNIIDIEIITYITHIIFQIDLNNNSNIIINEFSFDLIKTILNIFIKNNYEIPVLLGQKILCLFDYLLENEMLNYQIKDQFFFFKLLQLNIKEEKLENNILEFLKKVEFLINDNFYHHYFFKKSLDNFEYFNKITKYILQSFEKEKNISNSKVNDFSIKSGLMFLGERKKISIYLDSFFNNYTLMFSFRIFKNNRINQSKEYNIFQYSNEKNNKILRFYYEYLNNALNLYIQINNLKPYTYKINFSTDYFICISSIDEMIKNNMLAVKINKDIFYIENDNLNAQGKSELLIFDNKSYGIFGDLFLISQSLQINQFIDNLNYLYYNYHFLFSKNFPKKESMIQPQHYFYDQKYSINIYSDQNMNPDYELSQRTFQYFNNAKESIKNYQIELPIYLFINNKGIEFLILQLHSLSSQNDNIIFNKGICSVLSIMTCFLSNKIYSNYFKNENEKYLLNLFFLNFISIFYNTNDSLLKIQITDSLFEKIKFFIIGFNSNKNWLSDLLISIILDLKFYQNKNIILNSFDSIIQLINNNNIDLKNNKDIIEKIIKIGLIINKKYKILYFEKILLNLINKNNKKLNNFIISTITIILQDLSDNNSFSHEKKYQFLKFLYFYLNKIKKDLDNSFYTFLNNQFNIIKYNHCKYCSRNIHLCYLIIQNFSTKITKDYFKYSFMLKPNIDFIYCVILKPFDKLEPNIKWEIIKTKDLHKLNYSSYALFSNIKIFNDFESIYFYLIYIINREYSKEENKESKKLIEKIILFLLDFFSNLYAIENDNEEQKKISNEVYCKSNICVYYFVLYYKFNKKNFKKISKFLIQNLINSYYNPFIFKVIFPFNIKAIMIDFKIREYFFEELISKFKNEIIENDEITNNIIFLSYIYQYLLKKQSLSINLLSNIQYFLDLVKTHNFIKCKFLIPDNPYENNNNITIIEIIIKIIILLSKNYQKDYSQFFYSYFVHEDQLIELEEYDIEMNNNITEKLSEKYIPYNFLNSIIFLNELMNLYLIFNKNDEIMENIICNLITKSISKSCELLKKNKTNELLKKIPERIKFGKNILEEYQKNNTLSKDIIIRICKEKNLKQKSINEFEQKNNKEKEKEIKHSKKKNKKRKLSNCFYSYKKKFDYIKNYHKKRNSFEIKSNLFITINNSKNNSNQNNENLPDYYFNKIFTKDNKFERKFCFNPKKYLLWHFFSYTFSDMIFHSEKFINLKKSFQLYFSDLNINHNKDEKGMELDYPTKKKNFTVSAYYKPFLKPDLKFFKNPLLSISHNYYNNNKKDPQLLNIKFKRIIPTKKSNNKIECEYIFNKGSIYGEIHFYDNYFVFFDESENDERFKNNNFDTQINYIFSSDEEEKKVGRKKYILIFINDIEEILSRRFYFQYIGFEIFIKNKKSYLFNFLNINNLRNFKEEFMNNYNKLNPKKKVKILKTDLIKEFKKENYTNEYIKGKLSSFHYLLMINKFSTRTYNNLNQYLIMPLLFLSDTYKRKLDQVICVQKFGEQIDKQELKMKYLSNYDTNECHFNIHYSNQGFIMYYLIRVNPITTEAINFQSGKFDYPSRIFNSIESFYSTYQISEENRELIPEFFYDYNFMLNLNKNNLGDLNLEQIHNVNVSPFNNTVEYILYLRKKLNEYDIHDWIDIIFGYLQTKKEDENYEHFRIFPKYTYSQFNNLKQKIDEIKTQKTIKSIMHFRDYLSFLLLGNVPVQMFTYQHGTREKNKINYKIDEQKLYNNFKKIYPNKEKKVFFIIENNIIFLLTQKSLIELDDDLNKKKEIEFKLNNQISFLQNNNCFCHYLKEYYFFCRFIDCSIRIYYTEKDFVFFFWNCFVTSIIIQCLKNENKKYLIIGDRYGYISKLRFLEKELSLRINKSYKKHKSSINFLIQVERLDIIISADMNNSIVISNINDLETICQIKLDENIEIISIYVTKYDLLYICNSQLKKNYILCYTLNGLFVMKKSFEFKFNFTYYIEEFDKLVLIGDNKCIFYELFNNKIDIRDFNNCINSFYINKINNLYLISKEHKLNKLSINKD